MQFAAQRTNMELEPIGEPYNYLIKLSEDVLPDPDAVLLTGITPQATTLDGITEAEFLKIFTTQIATPGTIFTGFNSVRFDDEFMRFLHYRNYYDAYEWQWQDGRSRWDILDIVRMTRALRPEGINWPVDDKGQPANKLTLLTEANGLDHTKAHDALSDVEATIALSRLLRDKQPKLFEFMLQNRHKKQVAELTNSGQPFVYTSGKYASEYQKTTVVTALTGHPKRPGLLVYDLRHDPEPFLGMTPAELAEAWKYTKDETKLRLPVKSLFFNRCPAVAPLSVFNADCQQRLQLPLTTTNSNLNKLQSNTDFISNVLQALDLFEEHQKSVFAKESSDVDARLYDGFMQNADKSKMQTIRNIVPSQLSDMAIDFQDSRLSDLLPLYKARNFPKTLLDTERSVWEEFKRHKLLDGGLSSRAARYFERLKQLSAEADLTPNKAFLLEELQLYGQSILPEEY